MIAWIFLLLLVLLTFVSGLLLFRPLRLVGNSKGWIETWYLKVRIQSVNFEGWGREGEGREKGGYLLQKHTYEMYGCVLSVLAFKQDWDWCWSCLVQTLFLPASFLLKSQDIEYTTVQWLNTGWMSGVKVVATISF